jgi:hypothetical protein
MSVIEPGSGRKYFSAADKGHGRGGTFAVSDEGDSLKPSVLPNEQTVGMAKEKVSK